MILDIYSVTICVLAKKLHANTSFAIIKDWEQAKHLTTCERMNKLLCICTMDTARRARA